MAGGVAEFSHRVQLDLSDQLAVDALGSADLIEGVALAVASGGTTKRQPQTRADYREAVRAL